MGERGKLFIEILGRAFRVEVGGSLESGTNSQALEPDPRRWEGAAGCVHAPCSGCQSWESDLVPLNSPTVYNHQASKCLQ